MYTMHNFYIFFTALFMALVMVPAVRKWALDSGAVDRPGGRRAHDQVVARAGGIAIFIPFMFSLLVYVDVDRGVRGVLAGALVLFVTGLADDIYQLSPRYKFYGQVLGCLVAMLVGQLYLTNLGDLLGFGDIVLPFWMAAPLTLFALVGVVNALNLIDGLDGLAAGISLIALAAFSGLALQEGNLPVLALCAALAGGLVGFLKYNAFPARIFMGDTGSLVVGFVLGCLALMLTQSPHGNVSAVLPLLILSVPIIDTLVVMIGRKMRGKSATSADQTHLHHQFLTLGLGHSRTVLVVYAIAFFWALVALLFRFVADYFLFAALLFGSLLMHLVIAALTKQQQENPLIALLNSRRLGQHTSGLAKRFDQSLGVLLTTILLLYAVTVGAQFQGSVDISFFTVSIAVLGLAGLLLSAYWGARSGNLFCFLLLAPVMLIGYYSEQLSTALLIAEFSLPTLLNLLFVGVTVLLAAKFVLLDSVRRIFDTPFTLALFALTLALAVVGPEADYRHHLSGVLSKSIVLFIALKFLVTAHRRYALSVAAGLCGALLVMLL